MINTTADRLEVTQASIKRARLHEVRVWQVKGGLWRARSKSGKGPYTLQTHEQENGFTGITCSCPGAVYHGYCKHIARLAMVLDSKGIKVQI